MVCLLTIHGVGFQQPPQPPKFAGYADGLHANLRAELEALLGDDPQRTEAGGSGPVYVASEVDGDVERGLDRIARTLPDGNLDWSDRPLAPPGSQVAHVALVYAGLGFTRPHLGVGLRALVVAVVRHRRYASIPLLWRLYQQDRHAIRPVSSDASAETRVRRDIGRRTFLRRRRQDWEENADARTRDTLLQLEDDVAMYVFNRRLHDGMQEFVREVVQRLLKRDDVAMLVINAHSQGSIVSFDMLQPMSTHQLDRIGAFVTAGSPLRKYVDYFGIGRDLSGAGEVPWLNFWDRHDPAADPLAPPVEWRPMTDATVHPGQFGLFRRRRGGGFVALAHVVDRTVDNLAFSSGGGLQARHYWDNKKQFIDELAKVLRGLI